MAYEIAILKFLAKILSGLLIQEAKHLHGVSKEITTIRRELEWIHAFLKDAAKDKKRHQYMMMEVWVNQIRDEGYNAEDIIETYILKVEQHQHRNFAFRLLSNSRNVITIHDLGMQLKQINVQLERIATSRQRYGLENINLGDSSSTIEVSNAKNDPTVEETNVQGFDEDAKKLEKALSRGESSRRSVVSIVGMGGLGKTTLAKYVFNRMLKTTNFEIHSWIYVSKEYRVRDLFLRAMKQVKQAMAPLTREEETEMETMNEEKLKSELLKNLSGKRYLVVIDEIWTKEDWDLIEKAFPDDQNCSRIMLTTRNRDVAQYADPSSNSHDLHLLNKGDSWKLFCKKVFPANSCPDELTQLGQDIVANTGGLPLAITLLGDLLYRNTHLDWEEVHKKVDWYLLEDSKLCTVALATSYNDLSDHLKLCFLYFGMFPKGMEIEADKLIHLWIAEDFIDDESDRETMEDVAEAYLKELVQRSMVQVTRRRVDQSAETCRVHDLLRELAISEANRDEFFKIYGINQASRSRRLATHLEEGMYETKLQHVVNLRSLLCFTEGLGKDIWSSRYGDVKLLRVLDLFDIHITELPNEIGELILLKYLGLCQTWLRELPGSIGNLVRLQTLDLRGTDVTLMPSIIGKLKQLRHFSFQSFPKDSFCRRDLICNDCVLNQIGGLRELQTLGVQVGRWIKGGLENLTNLRELKIEGELRQYSELLSESLSKFWRLQSLELVEYSEATPLPFVSFSNHKHLAKLVLLGPLEKLPDKKDFPPNLTCLELSRSFLDEGVDPMVTLEKLPKLRALKMEMNTYSKNMTCSEEGFTFLRHLEMSHHMELEEWIVNEGAMRNLRSLRMDMCKRLTMLPDALKRIPKLKEVNLSDMPRGLENWWQN